MEHKLSLRPNLGIVWNFHDQTPQAEVEALAPEEGVECADRIFGSGILKSGEDCGQHAPRFEIFRCSQPRLQTPPTFRRFFAPGANFLEMAESDFLACLERVLVARAGCLPNFGDNRLGQVG